jgi:hypothetical protein
MSDELPELSAAQPSVTPAIPEKTFSSMWLQKLHVEGRPESGVRLYAELKPYDHATGECSPSEKSDVVTLEIPNVFALSDPIECPELSAASRIAVGQAMGAVLAAMALAGKDKGVIV